MAPVYFIIIGITGMIFGWYNANSSFVVAEDPYHNCNDYWWRNALFINNLYPWNELVIFLMSNFLKQFKSSIND